MELELHNEYSLQGRFQTPEFVDLGIEELDGKLDIGADSLLYLYLYNASNELLNDIEKIFDSSLKIKPNYQ